MFVPKICVRYGIFSGTIYWQQLRKWFMYLAGFVELMFVSLFLLSYFRTLASFTKSHINSKMCVLIIIKIISFAHGNRQVCFSRRFLYAEYLPLPPPSFVARLSNFVFKKRSTFFPAYIAEKYL